MSRFKLFVLIPFLTLMIKPLATVAASPSIVISEVQTGSTASSSQEFVELYNPTPEAVTVDGWALQYKSATSAIAESSWTKRADLSGSVPAHGFYLISQKTYLVQADADLSTSGLSGTGGHIRIKDASGNIVDLVGWGSTANAAETAPATAPAAGQSIERLPGRMVEDGGNATDTGDNSHDFVLRSDPQAQSTASITEEPALGAPIVTDDPPVDDQPADAPVFYAPIIITEVMPDPAAPLTDTHDEFVELYNPNPDPVNLKDYTLRSGSSLDDYFNLPDETIAPAAYLAVYAYEGKISLTNTGGVAELLDPTGAVVSTTDNYGKAATGQSWSLIDNVWKWSMQATPGAENIFEAPPVPEPKSAATPKAKSTTAAAVKPKTSSAPKSTAKTGAVKTTKKAAPKSTKVQKTAKTALVAAANNRSGSWLLIGVAALSIGYALYEFRYDVRNYYYITKRYLKARRGDRSGA